MAHKVGTLHNPCMLTCLHNPVQLTFRRLKGIATNRRQREDDEEGAELGQVYGEQEVTSQKGELYTTE